ncbi:serine/threonine protein kinase [Labilithrix luteola]|uniref:Serine/threonine protein kinase n=1 Tax=Labilithrix luteola TaxID=1391654 RepID=A0A0K1QGY3_9BACT|nr:serine/threonine-protein kinase [Labilithrix luteola]AKV04695.1 serine/threonine protein kinase [Labilithrix luteola]
MVRSATPSPIRTSTNEEGSEDAFPLGEGRSVQLVSVLGRGSCATVHRALVSAPHGLRREVAVKLFNAAASEEAETVATRLLRAARRLAWVRHPNVVAVYEFGVWQRQPFFVTEFVSGITLQTLMDRTASRGKRMRLDLALFIATAVANALGGARRTLDHQGSALGILHLGLSPREILVSSEGEVKVEGFELSPARAASSTIRNLRAIASRLNLMAPEIALGHRGDARSDVFSLGVLLRELVVGPRFPRGISQSDAYELACQGYVETLSFAPWLPDDLVTVMERALRIAPEERYPNASVMAAELRLVASAMGVSDDRHFLRSALESEWASDAGEVTREMPQLVSAAPLD